MITNNDILIAKLKQGFKITTFELSDAYGTMAHLTYYPSKIKNETPIIVETNMMGKIYFPLIYCK